MREVRLGLKLKQAMCKDRIHATDELTQIIEEASIRDDTKSVHQTLDRVAPRERSSQVAIKNEDDSMCMDRKEELARWGRHVIQVFEAVEVAEELPSPPPYLREVDYSSCAGTTTMRSMVLLRGPRIEVYIDGSAMKEGRSYWREPCWRRRRSRACNRTTMRSSGMPPGSWPWPLG